MSPLETLGAIVCCHFTSVQNFKSLHVWYPFTQGNHFFLYIRFGNIKADHILQPNYKIDQAEIVYLQEEEKEATIYSNLNSTQSQKCLTKTKSPFAHGTLTGWYSLTSTTRLYKMYNFF